MADAVGVMGGAQLPLVALPRMHFPLVQDTGRGHPERRWNSRIGIKLHP